MAYLSIFSCAIFLFPGLFCKNLTYVPRRHGNVPMQLSMAEVMVLVQWASARSIICQNVFTWTLYSSFAKKELNSCDKCSLWSYNICSKWCPVRWWLLIRKPLHWWLLNKHCGASWAQLCSMMASHVAAGALRLFVMQPMTLNGALRVNPLPLLLLITVHLTIVVLVTMEDAAILLDPTLTCLDLPSRLKPSTELELYLFSTGSMFSSILNVFPFRQ